MVLPGQKLKVELNPIYEKEILKFGKRERYKFYILFLV